jgi:hypothetical protein
MAAPKSIKRKLFCELIDGGMSPREAYPAAGWKAHSSNPYTMLKEPDVVAYLADLAAERNAKRAEQEALQAQANSEAAQAFVAKTKISRELILERMQRIAEIADGTLTLKVSAVGENGETIEAEESRVPKPSAADLDGTRRRIVRHVPAALQGRRQPHHPSPRRAGHWQHLGSGKILSRRLGLAPRCNQTTTHSPTG